MSKKNIHFTHFASPYRLFGNALQEQINHFKRMTGLLDVLNAIPDCAVILNECRQVVFCNEPFLIRIDQPIDQILGRRVGEIFQCGHSCLEPGGCGVSEYCSVCGAVNAVTKSFEGNRPVKDDFRLSTIHLESYEFDVQSTPYHSEIGTFVFFTLKDVSEVRRKEALEKIFYHDLLNTAGGMRGVAELIASGESSPEFTEIVLHLADEMIDEIKNHRLLSAAEKDELKIEKVDVRSFDILDAIQGVFSNHEIVKDKNLHVAHSGDAFTFKTDSTLLKRVLINMTKNAFEASDLGKAVTVSVASDDHDAIFQVHNHSFINRDTQLQLFKRSFSTKGKGRGLGTYSMRLLGEKYLGGKVGFVSDETDGTTFFIKLSLEE